jgi:hypothetical protein
LIFSGTLAMDDVIHVHRVAATAAVPTGLARCGASEVDITPHAGLPMAGYAIAGKVARGMRGRLYARTLYLEDARGQRSALCFVDLFAASRYVLERAAFCTARVCSIAMADTTPRRRNTGCSITKARPCSMAATPHVTSVRSSRSL